ncbi:hypothetical protein NPIL_698951 [Nephila pilipes]|uniref:Uncharacterized protein n=1 Tax=Nephila pilipes TaxID=299642 RepID=A0A8X6T498_NEPPI|nr:hypothetical protein NPIL_698951 [Nephila pilipes]
MIQNEGFLKKKGSESNKSEADEENVICSCKTQPVKFPLRPTGPEFETTDADIPRSPTALAPSMGQILCKRTRIKAF